MEIGLHEVLEFVYLWIVAVACILLGREYFRRSASDEPGGRKPSRVPVAIATFVVLFVAFMTADPLVSLLLD